jgi:hypothetical protein
MKIIESGSCRSFERRSENRTLVLGENRRFLDRSVVMELPPNAFRLRKPARRADAQLNSRRAPREPQYFGLAARIGSGLLFGYLGHQ